MSDIYKYIFEEITGQLTLPVEPILSFVITWIINKLAFRNAWDTVRACYRGGVISGRGSGSRLHWLIRGVTFIAVWAVVYVVIVVCRFIVEHWIIITYTLLVLAAIIGMAAIAIRCYKKEMKSLVSENDVMDV